ncbi:hypothetical protein S7711_11045 [Stachybotrys chartarum IBT 7711]|uniref:Rhodopsin domain-containing protein n=1 Tax=Stachybotrys chartarum (strain CBS 109288 / IBT 7711) TaxID=1280523 RepID=A0A084BBA6_STACB|nr:hypothetical protein S7711_11045 [Stachybotrys chartarum IBT 7711]
MLDIAIVAYILAATMDIRRLYGLMQFMKREGRVEWMMMATSSVVSTNSAMSLFKISIALNVIQVSTNRWYYRAAWLNVVLALTWAVFDWAAFFSVLKPTNMRWDPYIHGNRFPLDDHVEFGLVDTLFRTSTDFIMITLPTLSLWRSEMGRERQLWIMAILAVVYFSIANDVYKAVYKAVHGPGRAPAWHSFTDSKFIRSAVGIFAYIRLVGWKDTPDSASSVKQADTEKIIDDTDVEKLEEFAPDGSTIDEGEKLSGSGQQ